MQASTWYCSNLYLYPGTLNNILYTQAGTSLALAQARSLLLELGGYVPGTGTGKHAYYTGYFEVLYIVQVQVRYKYKYKTRHDARAKLGLGPYALWQ